MTAEEKELMVEYLTSTAGAMKMLSQQVFNSLYELWMKHKSDFDSFAAFLADYDEKHAEYLSRFGSEGT